MPQGLFGSSTWARTRDLRINSPALYRLSYRGIQPKIIAREIGKFDCADWFLTASLRVQSNTGLSTPSTLCSLGLVVVYCKNTFLSGEMMGMAPKAARAHS